MKDRFSMEIEDLWGALRASAAGGWTAVLECDLQLGGRAEWWAAVHQWLGRPGVEVREPLRRLWLPLLPDRPTRRSWRSSPPQIATNAAWMAESAGGACTFAISTRNASASHRPHSTTRRRDFRRGGRVRSASDQPCCGCPATSIGRTPAPPDGLLRIAWEIPSPRLRAAYCRSSTPSDSVTPH
jgi:hypothetical protein